jgi:preprotein translocase subunit YajC
MIMSTWPGLFAMGPPPSQQGGGSSAPFLVQIFPFILMFAVLYLIMIRPQQKKAKEHAELLKTLRPGDRVLTSGGIIGIVIGIKDKSVSLRSADTKLEVLKSAISEVTERSSAPVES